MGIPPIDPPTGTPTLIGPLTLTGAIIGRDSMATVRLVGVEWVGGAGGGGSS